MANMDKSVDKNTETSNGKKQNAVIAALVIGLLAGFFIGRSWGQKYEEKGTEEKAQIVSNAENVENVSGTKGSVSSKTKTEETEKTTPVSFGNATGAVTVADQTAGMSVVVSKVTLSEGAWVVVREDTGGAMGNILGARWLPAGMANDVSVELLRGTEAKKNYFVALYADNGDKKFDKATDLPIATGGKVVSGVFSAK